MPTQTPLTSFEGAEFRLPSQVWEGYDWSISHCVLRSDNAPFRLI